MKKSSNKGFMLTETLLVSAFVIGVMTFIISQFSALKRSYDNNFNYNTVNGLYNIKSIHEFNIKYGDYTSLKNTLENSNVGYITKMCNETRTNCNKLKSLLNISKVYFIKDNVFNIENEKAKTSELNGIFNNDKELYHFIKKIKFDENNNNAFHWVIEYVDEYNNKSFASLKLELN